MSTPTIFEVQTATGQAWLTAKAYIDALTAERDAAQTALTETQTFAASIIANAKAVIAAAEPSMVDDLSDLLEQAETPAQTRKRLALEAEIARLQAEKAALE